MNLTANIRMEEGVYWATIEQLPGVFASGDTLDELFESLAEGVVLHLGDGPSPESLHVASATLTDATPA